MEEYIEIINRCGGMQKDVAKKLGLTPAAVCRAFQRGGIEGNTVHIYAARMLIADVSMKDLPSFKDHYQAIVKLKKKTKGDQE